MADVNTAPKLSKKRKLGKNKKKSWRASNVDDVEEFLEDERRQIRTGGLVAEKADDTLFVIDTGNQQHSEYESKNKRRRRDKPLKCLSLLQPDPHSKVVRKPDNDNFQKGKRSKRILDRLRERSQSAVRVAAQNQRQTYEANRKVKQEQKKQLPVVNEDLWADETDIVTVNKIKPPKKYGKKPSALSATVIPHPGASINPSYEDHQDLLQQANLKEVEKLKKERKIHNALDAKFPTKEDAPNQSTYLVEMSAGLVDDSDDEDEEDEDIPLSVNPPVRREDRKTKKQRRVEKEEEEMMKKKMKETEVKRRENMVLRIPTLKSDINKQERKKKQKAALKQKRKEQESFTTKRLGSIKFEEPDLDLKLSEELTPSLREVKPEGHLLRDIYKSLQRRNIVEPRIKQKNKRKYKPKVFEKKGHRAVTL